MTIAENIETTRMSLSSPHKSPANGEKKSSRMKSKTSGPGLTAEQPQSREKSVIFKTKKGKSKILKQPHQSNIKNKEDEANENLQEKSVPPEFKNFLNDRK